MGVYLVDVGTKVASNISPQIIRFEATIPRVVKMRTSHQVLDVESRMTLRTEKLYT